MKTCLITGASSALGLAMSRRLLDRGDRVVAAVRRSEPLSLVSVLDAWRPTLPPNYLYYAGRRNPPRPCVPSSMR